MQKGRNQGGCVNGQVNAEHGWGSNPQRASWMLCRTYSELSPLRGRELMPLSTEVHPSLTAGCSGPNFPALLADSYPWLSSCSGESSQMRKCRGGLPG